jgi:hypothetical protein
MREAVIGDSFLPMLQDSLSTPVRPISFARHPPSFTGATPET